MPGRNESSAAMTDANTLLLAGSTGGYRERRPVAALDRHFLCVWSHTLTPAGHSDLGVVPDGCVDLVWIDGELTVAGPDVTVAVSSVTRDDTVVGVRFRAGAART